MAAVKQKCLDLFTLVHANENIGRVHPEDRRPTPIYDDFIEQFDTLLKPRVIDVAVNFRMIEPPRVCRRLVGLS